MTYQNFLIEKNNLKNNAGGDTFITSDLSRLNRFLILGSKKGTCYIDEKTLTKQNLDFIIDLIKQSGEIVIEECRRISINGLSPKQSPVLVTVALCLVYGNDNTKQLTAKYFNEIVRTGKQLLEVAGYIKQQKSFSRFIRKVISNWYNQCETLPLQVTKYRNNNQSSVSSHKKLLRLSHISPEYLSQETLFGWIINGNEFNDELLYKMRYDENYFRIPLALYHIKNFKTEDQLIDIIEKYSPTLDMISTQKLTLNVYKALIPSMPINTLLRNINNMSRKNVIDKEIKQLIINKFSNKEIIQKARLHPLNILLAIMSFENVDEDIINVVNDMFEISFKEFKPTSKKISLNFDVSGSMFSSFVNGSNKLTAIDACAAFSLVLKKSENENINSYQFDHQYNKFDLQSTDTVKEIVQKANERSFGCTDCSLPMIYALEHNLYYDCFIIMTDNEHWYGEITPYEALSLYREKINKDAKMIVLSTSATECSIANPDVDYMLDICGFDSSVFQIAEMYLKGDV